MSLPRADEWVALAIVVAICGVLAALLLWSGDEAPAE